MGRAFRWGTRRPDVGAASSAALFGEPSETPCPRNRPLPRPAAGRGREPPGRAAAAPIPDLSVRWVGSCGRSAPGGKAACRRRTSRRCGIPMRASSPAGSTRLPAPGKKFKMLDFLWGMGYSLSTQSFEQAYPHQTAAEPVRMRGNVRIMSSDGLSIPFALSATRDSGGTAHLRPQGAGRSLPMPHAGEARTLAPHPMNADPGRHVALPFPWPTDRSSSPSSNLSLFRDNASGMEALSRSLTSRPPQGRASRVRSCSPAPSEAGKCRRTSDTRRELP
jgi:hypothetical protein